MVKGFAQCWTEAGEEPDAENSHVQAVAECHGDGAFDFVRLILRLRLRDCREQDDGEGVGNGGWKEDKGECHACENSVNTDRFNPREPGEEKLVRYKDGFETLEKAEREAIRHEGECHGEEGEEQGSNRCVCIWQYGNGLRASIN